MKDDNNIKSLRKRLQRKYYLKTALKYVTRREEARHIRTYRLTTNPPYE